MSESIVPAQRTDRWLWHARMFRTRSLAARFAVSGKLRVNGARVTKASHSVAVGDVLTFALHGRVRVLRVVALAERRGPYAEASRLYEDLSPPAAEELAPEARPAASRDAGAGRPTKRERRDITSFTTPSE